MPRRSYSPTPRPYAGAQFGKTALTRVCRRAGMQRIAGDLYPVLNAMLDRYCTEVLIDAVMAAQVKGHKTVSLEDMRFSLQNRGEDVYGLGSTVARPSRRRPRDEAKEKEAKVPAAPAEPAPAVLAAPAAPAPSLSEAEIRDMQAALQAEADRRQHAEGEQRRKLMEAVARQARIVTTRERQEADFKSKLAVKRPITKKEMARRIGSAEVIQETWRNRRNAKKLEDLAKRAKAARDVSPRPAHKSRYWDATRTGKDAAKRIGAADTIRDAWKDGKRRRLWRRAVDVAAKAQAADAKDKRKQDEERVQQELEQFEREEAAEAQADKWIVNKQGTHRRKPNGKGNHYDYETRHKNGEWKPFHGKQPAKHFK